METIPQYRTAIVGCGPRAAAHAVAYRDVTAGSLVACCDVNEERLRQFGDRFGIQQRFTDIGAMLRAVQPDLVDVVTAPTVRWPVIEAILPHRPRAILLEKPLASRPSEGYRILNECQRAGVALCLNHQLRHHAPFQRLRDAVQSGELGAIEWARASCRGNLLEQGTHLFDMVSFVFDDAPADWIFAQAEGVGGFGTAHSSPSYAAGVLCLASGTHVSFECGEPAPTWRSEPNYWLNKGIEVVGTKGRAGSSTNRGWWIHAAAGLQGESASYGEEDDRAQARLTQSLLEALDAPAKIAEHLNSPARSQISFDLVMAAERSALLRARVPVAGERVTDDEIEALRAALA